MRVEGAANQPGLQEEVAGAKGKMKARKGRTETEQEVVKKELWQGAASQRQKVCERGKQRD